jgi:hypothetical protein
MAAIEAWAMKSYAAQALGVVPYAILFYASSRYFAFKTTRIARSPS